MEAVLRFLRRELSEPFAAWALWGLALGTVVFVVLWQVGDDVNRWTVGFAGYCFVAAVMRRNPVDAIGLLVGRMPAPLRLVVILPLLVIAAPLVVITWCAYQVRRGWVGPPDTV